MDRTDYMKGSIWPESDPEYAIISRGKAFWGDLDLAQYREARGMHNRGKTIRVRDFRRPPAEDSPSQQGHSAWHYIEIRQRRESRNERR